MHIANFCVEERDSVYLNNLFVEAASYGAEYSDHLTVSTRCDLI